MSSRRERIWRERWDRGSETEGRGDQGTEQRCSGRPDVQVEDRDSMRMERTIKGGERECVDVLGGQRRRKEAGSETAGREKSNEQKDESGGGGGGGLRTESYQQVWVRSSWKEEEQLKERCDGREERTLLVELEMLLHRSGRGGRKEGWRTTSVLLRLSFTVFLLCPSFISTERNLSLSRSTWNSKSSSDTKTSWVWRGRMLLWINPP